MAVELAKRLITVDEYYKMAEVGILNPADRLELINGEIVYMSPIGSRHAGIVNRLNKILNNLLAEDFVISIQNPIELNIKNEPEPDISILKLRSDSYTDAHPTPEDIIAIIEVSDSSYEYDVYKKAALYASALISIYWVIDIENDRVEAYTNPKGDRYRRLEEFEKGEEVTLLDHSINITDILI